MLTYLYDYAPIEPGQARLLELLTDQKELTGIIHTFNIDEYKPSLMQDPTRQMKPRTAQRDYHALSHHWGLKGPTQSCYITIIHNDELYYLEIRPSLKEALESIREKTRSNTQWGRFLWVDAICIDQDSKKDKGLQLPVMGDIYNSAKSVIVWLGSSTSESRTAIKFVERLQNHHELRDCLHNHEHADDWKALAMLTRRAWFTRLWIVQEIAAAKQAVVLVGEDSILWDDFASALSLFGKQYDQVRRMLMKSGEFSRNSDWLGEIRQSGAYMLAEAKDWVLRKRSDGRVSEHIKTLEGLLTTLSTFEVTQPHDVVYAIMWLSSDANLQRKKQRGRHRALRLKSPTREEEYMYRLGKRSQSPDEIDGHRNKRGRPNILDERETSNILMLPVIESPSLSRRSSISGQYLRVSAQAAEQAQADRNDQLPHGPGIAVDYDSTVFNLCKSVLEHIIGLTGSLDIICFPWAPPPQTGEPNHPSWLLQRRPNKYTRPRRGRAVDDEVVRRTSAETLVGRPGARRRPYLACGRTKGRDAKIEGRVLHVGGYSLATVSDVGETALDGVISTDWLQKLGWSDTSQPPPDRFWRLLVGNQGSSEFGDCPSHFKLACKWAWEMVGENDNLNLALVRDDGDKEAVFTDFIERALAVTWNRKLIISESCSHLRATDSNLVGLGPRNAQVGDHICILWGCAVPVLLRPKRTAPPCFMSREQIPAVHSDGALKGHSMPPALNLNDNAMEHFEFVGEAYVDQFMGGEAFDFVDSHGKHMQDFFIH